MLVEARSGVLRSGRGEINTTINITINHIIISSCTLPLVAFEWLQVHACAQVINRMTGGNPCGLPKQSCLSRLERRWLPLLEERDDRAAHDQSGPADRLPGRAFVEDQHSPELSINYFDVLHRRSQALGHPTQCTLRGHPYNWRSKMNSSSSAPLTLAGSYC